MHKTLLALVVLSMTLAPAADAAPKWVRIATDATNDGPPSLDLTYLDVARNGKNLELRFGVSGMPPVTNGIPELPGIEWIFESEGRVFVAEAVPAPSPRFFLFEYDGTTFQQSQTAPTGAFFWDQGFAQMSFPLKAIGARSGTRLSGSDALGDQDVDAHVHLPGLPTQYPDFMKSNKSYRVP